MLASSVVQVLLACAFLNAQNETRRDRYGVQIFIGRIFQQTDRPRKYPYFSLPAPRQFECLRV